MVISSNGSSIKNVLTLNLTELLEEDEEKICHFDCGFGPISIYLYIYMGYGLDPFIIASILNESPKVQDDEVNHFTQR